MKLNDAVEDLTASAVTHGDLTQGYDVTLDPFGRVRQGYEYTTRIRYAKHKALPLMPRISWKRVRYYFDYNPYGYGLACTEQLSPWDDEYPRLSEYHNTEPLPPRAQAALLQGGHQETTRKAVAGCGPHPQATARCRGSSV